MPAVSALWTYLSASDFRVHSGITPQYIDAFNKVVAAAKKWGKPSGMWTSSATIQWAIEKGFTLNTVGSADGFMMQGANIALEKMRSLSKA